MKKAAQRILKRVAEQVDFYKRIWQHPETPRLPMFLVGLALAYFVSPIDLIPDAIPILGQLDDLLIVPGLLYLALRLVPEHVVAECRQGGK